MTSVPKPLKFLRPLYPDLQKLYETWEPSDDQVGYSADDETPSKLISTQSLFADILSVLAMTYSDTEPRGTLKYRLLSTTRTDPGLWGHEYIRHLASELGSEFTVRQEKDEDTKQLRELALECCRFLLRHNAEADAVDLLEELECIDEIRALVDKDTYARVCAYMVRYVIFLFVDFARRC